MANKKKDVVEETTDIKAPMGDKLKVKVKKMYVLYYHYKIFILVNKVMKL